MGDTDVKHEMESWMLEEEESLASPPMRQSRPSQRDDDLRLAELWRRVAALEAECRDGRKQRGLLRSKVKSLEEHVQSLESALNDAKANTGSSQHQITPSNHQSSTMSSVSVDVSATVSASSPSSERSWSSANIKMEEVLLEEEEDPCTTWSGGLEEEDMDAYEEEQAAENDGEEELEVQNDGEGKAEEEQVLESDESPDDAVEDYQDQAVESDSVERKPVAKLERGQPSGCDGKMLTKAMGSLLPLPNSQRSFYFHYRMLPQVFAYHALMRGLSSRSDAVKVVRKRHLDCGDLKENLHRDTWYLLHGSRTTNLAETKLDPKRKSGFNHARFSRTKMHHTLLELSKDLKSVEQVHSSGRHIQKSNCKLGFTTWGDAYGPGDSDKVKSRTLHLMHHFHTLGDTREQRVQQRYYAEYTFLPGRGPSRLQHKTLIFVPRGFSDLDERHLSRLFLKHSPDCDCIHKGRWVTPPS